MDQERGWTDVLLCTTQVEVSRSGSESPRAPAWAFAGLRWIGLRLGRLAACHARDVAALRGLSHHRQIVRHRPFGVAITRHGHRRSLAFGLRLVGDEQVFVLRSVDEARVQGGLILGFALLAEALLELLERAFAFERCLIALVRSGSAFRRSRIIWARHARQRSR